MRLFSTVSKSFLLTSWQQQILLATELYSSLKPVLKSLNMLSTLSKTSYILFQALYFHLPKYPYFWDKDYKKVVISSSYLSWSVFMVGWTVSPLVYLGNLYIVFTHFFVKFRQDLHFIQIFAMCVGSVFGTLVISVGLLLLLQQNQIINGFNQMQQLDTEMVMGRLFSHLIVFLLKSLSLNAFYIQFRI